MVATVTYLVLLTILALAAIFLAFAPLGAAGVMLWRRRRPTPKASAVIELRESASLSSEDAPGLRKLAS